MRNSPSSSRSRAAGRSGPRNHPSTGTSIPLFGRSIIVAGNKSRTDSFKIHFYIANYLSIKFIEAISFGSQNSIFPFLFAIILYIITVVAKFKA